MRDDFGDKACAMFTPERASGVVPNAFDTLSRTRDPPMLVLTS
jgi:hypothetical protein